MIRTDHIRIHTGMKVRQARKEKGLTQKELAQRSGLSSVYISHIETGKKSPTIDALNRIGFGLGASLVFEFKPWVMRKIEVDLDSDKAKRYFNDFFLQYAKSNEEE